MLNAGRRNLSIAAVIVVVLVAIDQWAKIWAYHHLRGQLGYSYFDNFVRVEYAENRGAFLSLGAGLTEEMRFWVFVVGVAFILGFCLYSLWRAREDFWSSFAFALVIAGGVGNLIDRVAQGFVIDYVHMGFATLRTGVFNVADVAISGGLILLVALQYLRPGDDSKSA